MTRPSKLWKLLAALFALSLIAAACGSDDDDASTSTTEAGGDTATTEAGGTATTAADGTGGEAEGDPVFRVTIDLDPDASWDDGTPITVADFQCYHEASLSTPASLVTAGYDKIISVDEGDSDKQVVLNFSEVYAPYRNLFNGLFPAHLVENCADVSADFAEELPFSGREWKIDSWSPEQLILSPNENYWNADKTPKAKRVVMVPLADTDTQINGFKSGTVDFIFPQAYAGIKEALDADNIKFEPGYGTNYEGMYLQQQEGPFADDAFRKGFFHSIDRDLILANIYDPIFPGAPLLQCGLWVPTIGPWCDNTQFEDSFDLEGAAAALEEGGYAKNAEGFWAKGGTVPEIRWMINAGNTRRESAQALLIPEFAKQGFKVIADNGDAATVFQKRLPALDFDLAMYINTASPDPTVTSIMSCDSVPTEENGFKGQNSTGWCNEEASEKMVQADAELDEAARTKLVHEIGQALVDDAVMVPLFQFPNIAAWNTDKLTGPIAANAANYRAFGHNLWEWAPTSGDEIIIGAEQWPECLNPITECASSSWYVWTTWFLVAPAVFDSTPKGTYEPTDLVVGEPKAEVLG